MIPLGPLNLIGPSAAQQDFARDQEMRDLGISTYGVNNGRAARLSAARLRAAVGARLARRDAFVTPMDTRDGRLL
jgi:hypothetical protein